MRRMARAVEAVICVSAVPESLAATAIEPGDRRIRRLVNRGASAGHVDRLQVRER